MNLNERRLRTAYAATHQAADNISRVWVEFESAGRLNVAELQDGLKRMRQALAAWETLERRAVGVPEPKVG